ncbi:hypothetical protein ABN028_19905 [Actinopolymorpha sp. B17G11]|uniref:hypothetical protein n=1 Tax=Actinopolymorpha sp. B17G11 TaxID=3160861 RepID=UPI0032E49FA0
MTLGVAAIAAIALVLSAIANWKNKWQKWILPLDLIAGLGLAGGIGSALNQAAGAVVDAGTSATSMILGVGVPVVIAIALGVIIYFDMRDGDPSYLTQGMTLVYPSVCTITGGFFAVLVSFGIAGLAMIATFVGALLSSFG